MDALQALVLAAAPASCASSSAAGSTTTVAGFRTPSEPDGWPLSSGTKRRRLVSKVKDELIDLSTPVKVKVKAEPYDDPDELGLSSVVKVEEEVGEKIQTCNGCARIKGSSVCFVNMDELVQWPPGSGGRGLWCRDCHTTWRTHFSATHTLLLFSKWIRVESNFRDFEAALVAYLSLRAEGGQDRRITSALIFERITMLRWLTGLLGWQLAPFMIKTLDEIRSQGGLLSSSSDDQPAFDPKSLCTIKTKDGFLLGVMVPSTLASCSSSFTRPCLPNTTPLLRQRALLATTSDADHAFAEDHWQMHLDQQEGDVVAGVQQVKKNLVASPAKSKMDVKLEALQMAPLELFNVFSSEEWMTVRESRFTKPPSTS